MALPIVPFRPRTALFVAPLALAAIQCAACANQVTYRGTGALTVSGVASQELAAEAPRLTRCLGPPPSSDPNASVEPVVWTLSIGDRCTLRGKWRQNTFQAEPGARCALAFPSGDRVLVVTDASARFGDDGRHVDQHYLEVRVGGELQAPDGTTKHALYAFAGNAATKSNGQDGCPAS
jgi:hypothetical protein